MRWIKLELIIQSEVSQKEKHQYSMLLLLSHFSRVRLCATPEMAAHQPPPSLGFSRLEHWSGLPFPSPMHETEHIFMDFRKTVMITLYVRQQKRHRCIEQTFGPCGR